MNIKKLFLKHEDEYSNFHLEINPRSQRPDLCAFMLLDFLVPSKKDLIVSLGSREILFGIDLADLECVITEKEVITLIRCGVRISSDDILYMFV